MKKILSAALAGCVALAVCFGSAAPAQALPENYVTLMLRAMLCEWYGWSGSSCSRLCEQLGGSQGALNMPARCCVGVSTDPTCDPGDDD